MAEERLPLNEIFRQIREQAALEAKLPQIQPPKRRRVAARKNALDAKLPVETSPEWKRLEIPFSGAMVIGEDPLKIGLQNYADLQNIRYTDVGLEGVQGYSKISSSSLAGGMYSGIQFIKTINATPTSHILVQVSTTIYQNLTAPPTAGNFSATTLFTDSSGAGLGRFALGPDGTVAYCNGVDAAIWGSTEHRAAAVFNDDNNSGATFRYDITDRLQNTLSDAANRFTLVRDGSNDIYLLMGSTRPLKGIKFYVQTANTAASTSTVEYWDGSAWQAVAGFSDGTASGGVTLAQTGTMSFTSTVSTARVKFISERLLYFYRVKVGATGTPDATIALYHATVDAPMQQIVDIWDGVERKPIAFVSGTYDYSTEVLEPSTVDAPIAADVWSFTAFELFFEERMTGVRLKILAGATSGSVVTVKYWNGSALTTVGTVTDTTTIGVSGSLGKSGDITWDAPAATSEFKVLSSNGRYGYRYELSFSPGLNSGSSEVLIDTVTGLPAQNRNPQIAKPGYIFPMSYQDRIMLCGAQLENEGNRIDYSATGAPDVYNGEDSSDQGKAIYVGSAEPLTAGMELIDNASTIAGRTIQSVAVVTKRRETWLLRGSTPDTFQLFPVSFTIGCPCPLTMSLATVPSGGKDSDQRTALLWISSSGPVRYDGISLNTLDFPQKDGSTSSIAPYFDPNDSRYVTVGSLAAARAWFDPQWGEWNVLLPTGVSTSPNVWLVADLWRQKWYRKVPSYYPHMGINVVDSTGGTYTYGGVDIGSVNTWYLMRLENSNTWDSTVIGHILDTSDMLPSQSMWDVTLIRSLKLIVARETGSSANISIGYALDGSGSFTTVGVLDVVGGSARWRKLTQPLNLRGHTHQWRLTVNTSDNARAPQLLGMGLLYRVEREALIDV